MVSVLVVLPEDAAFSMLPESEGAAAEAMLPEGEGAGSFILREAAVAVV